MFVTLCMLIRKAITKGCKALKAAGRMKQRKRTCLLLAMLQILKNTNARFSLKKCFSIKSRKLHLLLLMATSLNATQWRATSSCFNQWLCPFFHSSDSAIQEEEIGTLMSFSRRATSRCCVFLSQPSSLIFESQGGSISYPCWEKKGDLVCLKEHAGLRGLFPQRGGYESECHSRRLSRCRCMLPGSPPSLTSTTLLSLCHILIMATISPPFFSPLLVLWCPTGRGELCGSVGWLLFQSHLRCSEGPVKYRIIGRFQTAILFSYVCACSLGCVCVCATVMRRGAAVGAAFRGHFINYLLLCFTHVLTFCLSAQVD